MITSVSDFVSIAITYAVFGKDMAINRRAKRHSKSDCAAHNIGIESIRNCTAELLAEGVCIELLNVHHGSKILAREPALALSGIGPANIPGVTSRSIAPSAIIDEQTVGVKCLFESDIDELAVGSH